MANTGTTVTALTLTTALVPSTDNLLMQRGNSYFRVLAKSLTSGAYVEDTHANIITAIGAGNLERKATYYITDKYLFFEALEPDKNVMVGTYFARNADFQGGGVYSGITIANGFTVNATGTNLGIWTVALAPASGDVSIWNNTHYLKIYKKLRNI